MSHQLLDILWQWYYYYYFIIISSSSIIIIMIMIMIMIIIIIILYIYIYIIYLWYDHSSGARKAAQSHRIIAFSVWFCFFLILWTFPNSSVYLRSLSIGATDPVAQAIGSALSDACTTSTTIPQCPTEWDAEAGIFFKWRFSKIGDTPKPWVSNLILK